ncbi:MAG TPA: CoA-binding protein [Acidimicrobiales bacterium]|nr:CoA-binding protein [Acidimicrobiales bacterium]
MPARATIDDFLDQTHIAFVAVSRDPKAFANAVYRQLRDGGRILYPVNGSADGGHLEGDVSYRQLADVPDPVDGVVVMVPASAEADVVCQAVERGIPRVWIHRASAKIAVSDDVRSLCAQAGVRLVDGACPMMFVEPVRGIHRLHRRLARRHFAGAA